MPARLPSAGQVGVHMQAPQTQLPLVPQPAAPQLHVSMQVPLLHTLPAAHLTPAHRLTTQLPPAQIWLAAQVTVAQGLAGAHAMLQASPAPQLASHAVSATHLPVPGEQYCPDGQVTPLHGSPKQPGVHVPSTQVWLAGHVTPAHRSTTGTQLAWQLMPAPQVIAVPAMQGSGWQVLPRHT
jgi:hypothetical protein